MWHSSVHHVSNLSKCPLLIDLIRETKRHKAQAIWRGRDDQCRSRSARGSVTQSQLLDEALKLNLLSSAKSPNDIVQWCLWLRCPHEVTCQAQCVWANRIIKGRMSQLSPHPLLAQSRHISIIGLSGDESEPEWYIMIGESHELFGPVLTSSQSHAGKIRHTPHHVKHHRGTMLVKRHGYEISTEILHLQGLHLIKGESGQE